MVRSGFRLPWAASPAPTMSHPPACRPCSSQARSALDKEVLSMEEKGAIEEVSPHSRAFYGRLFTVPKSSGGLRPVLDLSPLNKHLQVIHFRMETPRSVRDAIRPGDWATSLDLKDAYFHVPIHRSSRKFLRFVWNDRVFQFRALPFGLSLAPWVFTKITRELAILARSRGIRLRMYLDDWLTLAASSPLALAHTEELMDLTLSLGFLPNWEKSALTPSQQFVYLGMDFDTVTYTVRPAPARLDRFRSLRDSLLRAQSSSARVLTSLLGQMESLAPLVPLGHVHKRKFQRQFRKRWHQAHQSWEVQIPLGVWLSRSLSQWLDEDWLQQGVPIAPPPCDEELFTDASNDGWGAHIAHLEASGSWPSSMKGCHINLLELEAVFLALKEFKLFIQNKHILVCTDNTTVACYVNKGGGRSFQTSVQESRGSPEVVSPLSDRDNSQICSRQDEHRGGFLESLESGHSNRVDSSPLGVRAGLENMAQTDGGFICHKVQLQTTSVLLPSSRPASPGSRRPGPLVEEPDRLRLPSSSSLEQGHPQGQDGAGIPHSDCALLALPALVSGPPRAVTHSSSQTSSSPERPSATSLGHSARKSSISQSTRLASVRCKLQSLGASTHLVHLVEKARRKGTYSVYDSHWKRWISWCEENGVDFASPSSVEFGNFLSYLFNHLGKSVSTVRVHRAAISSTIRQLGGPSFSEDPLIRDAIRGAALLAARTPRKLPAWDLFRVLASLRRTPYEPLSSANLKDLTFKTVFLTTLASGRRASEVNGLSGLPSDVSKEPDGSYSLRFLPEFLAKNQSPQDPSPIITILPLVPFCPDDEDYKLCPVRALKRYLYFTKSLRDGKRKLFISHNPSYKKDIIASTLSGWLRRVIAIAYQHDVGTNEPRDIRRAHEIRAWASSLAFQESWSLRDVLQAAYWRSESPFINFYLRDTRALRQDGSYGFSAVVAAGHIVRRH